MIKGSDRAAALAALDNDRRKRLAAYARFAAQGTGDEGDDLLQEAFLRWLGSDTLVEGLDQTYIFLRQAISSGRSNRFRHNNVVRRYEGVRAVAQDDEEEDPLDQAPDSAASADSRLCAQQLYDFFRDDGDVQLLIMAQVDGGTPAAIQAELGWDEHKYKAVQKTKRRRVIRLMAEGKLP